MYASSGTGRGAEVGAVLGEFLGPFAAQLGELVDVVVRHRRALVADEAVVLHRVQQRIDQPERQLHVLGEVAAGGFAAAVEHLEDQRFDFAFGEAGGGDALRLDRRPAFVLGTVALDARFARRRRRGHGLERPARWDRGPAWAAPW